MIDGEIKKEEKKIVKILIIKDSWKSWRESLIRTFRKEKSLWEI